MLESFRTAGFDESRCRFTVYDNTQGNVYEPYSAINASLKETTEPYLIFCHQDLLLNQGDGYDKLMQELAKLDSFAPNWAVAGNAGLDDLMRPSVRYTDRNGYFEMGTRPAEVCTLDENFMVLRPLPGVGCSPQLKGFHLYGTDVAFNAIAHGYTCCTIDFHLTHLSGSASRTDMTPEMRAFQRRWNAYFRFRLLHTPSNLFLLSRFTLLHRIFDPLPVRIWLIKHSWVYRRLTLLARKLHLEGRGIRPIPPRGA
jgi:hypothetical protein